MDDKKQVPVGEIVANDPAHGWCMKALKPWNEIGEGTLLYAAPATTASASDVACSSCDLTMEESRWLAGRGDPVAQEDEPSILDEVEQRTEKIRLAHANPADRSRTHLFRDVAHLLAHIALLKHPAATTASNPRIAC